MSLKRSLGAALLAAVIVASGFSLRSTQQGPTSNAQAVTSSPSQGPKGATGATGATGPAGPSNVLTGTTGSIGGGLLSAGSCASGTATVTGATVGMVATADPATYPGDGAQWQTYVSASNTVTVKVCALLLLTPVSTAYAVRVQP